jgi:hypothetical protein
MSSCLWDIKTPHCGLMIMLVKEIYLYSFYALMGELQLASVEIYGEIAFGRSAFKGLF